MTKPIKLDPPKTGTKMASLVSVLVGRGATINKLGDKLGWQPHTVRAALTRLRKRGYIIDRISAKQGAPSRFKIQSPPRHKSQ